jgi:CRISPR/Cas system-associated endoribonuclease Cas2
MNQTFVMSYDIADDAARSRMLRLMRKLADGYQYSVFEMEGDLENISLLLQQAAQIMTNETDRLMLLGGTVFSYKWQLGMPRASFQETPFLILL